MWEVECDETQAPLAGAQLRFHTRAAELGGGGWRGPSEDGNSEGLASRAYEQELSQGGFQAGQAASWWLRAQCDPGLPVAPLWGVTEKGWRKC